MLTIAGLLLCWAGPFADTPRAPVALRAQPPEIPHQSEEDWLNSMPLRLADLRGQVVVVNFWTFG